MQGSDGAYQDVAGWRFGLSDSVPGLLQGSLEADFRGFRLSMRWKGSGLEGFGV